MSASVKMAAGVEAGRSWQLTSWIAGMMQKGRTGNGQGFETLEYTRPSDKLLQQGHTCKPPSSSISLGPSVQGSKTMGNIYRSTDHHSPYLYYSLQNAQLAYFCLVSENSSLCRFLCIRLLYLLFLPEQYSWSTRAAFWINVEGFHRPYQQSPAQCGSRSQLLCSWDYCPFNI